LGFEVAAARLCRAVILAKRQKLDLLADRGGSIECRGLSLPKASDFSASVDASPQVPRGLGEAPGVRLVEIDRETAGALGSGLAVDRR
jgi:hypothetical protein